MTEENDVDPDPSVRLTRRAEQLQQVNERRAVRNLRDRVFTAAALVIVAITAGMVGYVLLVTTDSRTNAEMAACRSEYAAAVQVGVARALSGLAEASIAEEGLEGTAADDRFQAQLSRTASELEQRAGEYDAAAQLSGSNPEAFLKQCQEGP